MEATHTVNLGYNIRYNNISLIVTSASCPELFSVYCHTYLKSIQHLYGCFVRSSDTLRITTHLSCPKIHTRAHTHTLDLGTPIAIGDDGSTTEQIARTIRLTTTVEEPGQHHMAHGGCFWPVIFSLFLLFFFTHTQHARRHIRLGETCRQPQNLHLEDHIMPKGYTRRG